MKTMRSMGWLGMAALMLLAAATSAQAQMAKSGKFTAQFSWHFEGKNHELGEKYTSWSGQNWGVVINSAGAGFMHNAVGRCDANNVVKDGKEVAAGGCVFWDGDGDSAVIDWNGANDADGWTKGTFEWRGGTGKYSGITGKSKFKHRVLSYRGNGGPNGEGEGYSLWDGEYRLP